MPDVTCLRDYCVYVFNVLTCFSWQRAFVLLLLNCFPFWGFLYLFVFYVPCVLLFFYLLWFFDAPSLSDVPSYVHLLFLYIFIYFIFLCDFSFYVPYILPFFIYFFFYMRTFYHGIIIPTRITVTKFLYKSLLNFA